MPPARKATLPAESEAALQRKILSLAGLTGWRTAHFHDSRREVVRRGKRVLIGDAAARGFPDLVLVRVPRLVVAELKAQKGPIRPLQLEWLNDIAGCGVEAYLWRPSDWPEIEAVLA